MPTVTIVGGDFQKGPGHVSKRGFSLPASSSVQSFDTVKLEHITFLGKASNHLSLYYGVQESIAELSLLTPKNQILFLVRFDDSRTLLARAENKIYQTLKFIYLQQRSAISQQSA